MTHSTIPRFLRRVLTADGAITGATGLLMLFASEPLAALLGIPVALLRSAGVILIPFAAAVLYLSRRATVSRRSVWFVLALNSAWVVASILVLVGGVLEPTALGYAFIVVQAVAVAAFVELQYIGLRKSARAVASASSRDVEARTPAR